MNSIEPKDILPIPYFPYELNTFQWLLIIAALAAALFAVERLLRLRKNSLSLDLYPQLLGEISNWLKKIPVSADAAAIKQAAFGLSLRTRRYLSACEKLDFVTAGENELESFMRRGSRPETAAIVENLLSLERIKYAPAPQGAEFSETLRKLEHGLRSYRRFHLEKAA
ncbi:MAG: hypothetical protein J5J00_17430 [Deltaproteobacteria bacterium]|nr:hypothetical protein [Deltaproteobacteria bacterium]